MHSLIVETDIFSDVDDVGALAIAHALADEGLCEILAIGVNTPSIYGARAARAVNAFFDRAHIPVGRFPEQDDSVFESDYAKFLAENYPVPTVERDELAVTVHRRALAAATPASVDVVSLGFFGNLRDLLDSPPDEISDLDGRALISRAVARMVVMGGYYPEGYEFNIAQDPIAAAYVLEEWPTPIDLLGWEAGFEAFTGRALSRDDERNLVGAAYRSYTGEGAGRESWDLIAMHYAIAADPLLYRPSLPGRVVVESDGTTRFVAEEDGDQRYISLAVEPARVAETLDSLLERSTRARAF